MLICMGNRNLGLLSITLDWCPVTERTVRVITQNLPQSIYVVHVHTDDGINEGPKPC